MNSFEDFKKFAASQNIGVSDLFNGGLLADAMSVSSNVAPSVIWPDGPRAQGTGKLAILLHGFRPDGPNPFSQVDANNGRYADYQNFFGAIVDRLPGYQFSVAAYNTHQSFAKSAEALLQHYMTLGSQFDLSKTVLVGYSMGGLVARRMVASGLPFARLYTTCSPHMGVMPYLFSIPGNQYFFPGNEGATSMAPYSRDLWALNAADAHLHQRYHCHGIVYTDVRGFHADDSITEVGGATMGFGQVAQRWTTHIGMVQGLGFQPHLRGYNSELEWGSNRWAAAEFVNQIRGA